VLVGAAAHASLLNLSWEGDAIAAASATAAAAPLRTPEPKGSLVKNPREGGREEEGVVAAFP